VEASTGERLYTRLGALGFDSAGNMVDVNGSRVYGWNATGTPPAMPGTLGTIEAIKLPDPGTDYKFNNITINPDGTITALHSYIGTTTPAPDDKIVTLGQVAVANIQNQDALVMEGNSYYRASPNTGNITYEVPGSKGSGTGSLVAGALEMSNVDLANEFSDMIITQRGFQANTKIISVVDQMLEELVNLKR